MALTGWPGGAPLIPPAPVASRLWAIADEISSVAADLGPSLFVDIPVAVSGRAAAHGLTRAGTISANGSCRLLPGADGWVAINLARAEDRSAVSAVTGAGEDSDPWAALAVAATGSIATLVERAGLLGVAAARLGAACPPGPVIGSARHSGTASAGDVAWRSERLTPGAVRPATEGLTVVDLSSLWAGPLCARILASAGMNVMKVESTRRPDPGRSGPRAWSSWLHSGSSRVALDLAGAPGQEALRRLLEAADVVIEASRPRALEQMSLGPRDLDLRDGCVWLSLTGYGRADPAPGRVAFGDDAAVAGGLVAWDGDTPVFCGDALGDPVTGLQGALAVLRAVSSGGGVLIDLAMCDAVAAVTAAASAEQRLASGVWGDDPVEVRAVEARSDGWLLLCDHGPVVVAQPHDPSSAAA